MNGKAGETNTSKTEWWTITQCQISGYLWATSTKEAKYKL